MKKHKLRLFCLDRKLLTLSLFILAFQSSQAQRLTNWTDKIEENTLKKKDKETIVLTHYFATWCKPCMEELPIFDQLVRVNSEKVKMTFVCLDLENNPALVRRIKKLHLPGHVYYLSPTTEAIKHISTSWDGTLPYTTLQFPQESTPIEIQGKQTLDALQQQINHYEN